MRRRSASFVAGAFWGLVAWSLGAKVYGTGLVGGIIAAPFIGVGVGLLLQAPFENTVGWRRWLVSLASLYLGATLFALVVGVTGALAGSPARNPLQVVWEAVLGTWWGVTLTGFLIVLWPMAYLTHVVLEWVDDLCSDGRSA